MQATAPLTRNEVTARIKAALKKRSGRDWSVKGGRGTAWGWIDINSPAARQVCACKATENLRGEQCSHKYASYMSSEDQATLRQLLGFEPDSGYPVGWQGVSIPAGSDYWQEYLDRAEGRTPTRYGVQYWD